MMYRPLAEVRKVLRVKWYRSRIDPATLRDLSKRSDLQGWFQAGVPCYNLKKLHHMLAYYRFK